MGCHGNLSPFSSGRPHILLQTLFRCYTNNSNNSCFFFLSFEDFTTGSLGPLFLSMWYGPAQVLPSPLPLFMSFVSVLSFWAPTWSPMTISFASLWIFLVENPSLCFLKQTESFQTENKSLVLNAHCSSSCKTLKDHCAYWPLLDYSCNQLPATPIFSPASLHFCFWLRTLFSISALPCRLVSQILSCSYRLSCLHIHPSCLGMKQH